MRLPLNAAINWDALRSQIKHGWEGGNTGVKISLWPLRWVCERGGGPTLRTTIQRERRADAHRLSRPRWEQRTLNQTGMSQAGGGWEEGLQG